MRLSLFRRIVTHVLFESRLETGLDGRVTKIEAPRGAILFVRI